MRRSIATIFIAAAVSWGLGAPAGRAAEDYEALPAGPDRDAVYFNCSACHSIRMVTQQRLNRERWDELMDWMVEESGMHPLQPWARKRIVNYLAAHFGEEEEDWDGLPPGPGREEVYYACLPCHSLAIVKQQGLKREDWDETLVWMVDEQGMPELEAEERALILDYLSAVYGVNRAGGGS